MADKQVQKYEQEVLDHDNEQKRAIELLRQAGELSKPYDSTVLGSFSFHIFAKKDLMTGGGNVGLVTLSTEIDVKEEILGQLLEPIRDTILKLFGGELKYVRPRTEAEVEEDTALQIRAKESGLII